MKRVSLTTANGFVCERCEKAIKRIVEPEEEFLCHDQAELIKSYCYLGDRLNASSGSEAAMTARTRIG